MIWGEGAVDEMEERRDEGVGWGGLSEREMGGGGNMVGVLAMEVAGVSGSPLRDWVRWETSSRKSLMALSASLMVMLTADSLRNIRGLGVLCEEVRLCRWCWTCIRVFFPTACTSRAPLVREKEMW